MPNYAINIYIQTFSREANRPLAIEEIPASYGIQSSLPFSQEPSICPYPEPDQSNPCLPIPLSEEPF
jgi:hypothetical protein